MVVEPHMKRPSDQRPSFNVVIRDSRRRRVEGERRGRRGEERDVRNVLETRGGQVFSKWERRRRITRRWRREGMLYLPLGQMGNRSTLVVKCFLSIPPFPGEEEVQKLMIVCPDLFIAKLPLKI